MRAVVSGATGFVGRKLLQQLERPVVLTRNVERARKSLAGFDVGEIHAWDPLRHAPPPQAFAGADAVFHLAGESVADGRWSDAQKRKIRDSRELGTRHLVQALKALPDRPQVLVSASAVGYYGSRGDEVLDESAPPADDFLADVCVAWEREAFAAREAGVRVVTPRIGLVLGRGGALPKMLPPFKAGVGGTLGSGKQWMPWIHVDDLVGLLLHAATIAQVDGPMNAVAPQPITNRTFTKALGKALHRPTLLPVPYLGLRVLFGEFASVLFASQRVVPRVAEQTGYRFQFTDIEGALQDVLHNDRSPAEHAVVQGTA